MIYTLTLNPSLDYLMHVEELVLGETNRSAATDIHIGGKGINVSIVLNNLAMVSTAFGYYGGFTGRYLVEQLQRYPKIKESLIETSGTTRINVKLKGQVETEINGNGILVTEKAKQQLLQQIEMLTAADIIIVSGSFAAGIDATFYLQLVSLLAEKQILFAIDIADTVLHEVLTYKPLLIKPNEAELANLFGKESLTKAEIIMYGKQLAKEATYVIISRGSKGALFINGIDVYESIPPKGILIDSVGAGDSMVAGFIYAYSKKLGNEEIFKYACSCGTATAYTTDLATTDKINEIYQKTTSGKLTKEEQQ